MTTFTYDGQCAGWTFKYNDGTEKKHSLVPDGELSSPWASVSYILYPGTALKGFAAYEDATTATGGNSATAFEFTTTDTRIIPCGTKTKGASVRT